MAKLFFAIIKEVLQPGKAASIKVAKLQNGDYAIQDEEKFYSGLLAKMQGYLDQKQKPRLRALTYTREDLELAVRQAIADQIQEVKNLSTQIV